MGYRNTSGSPIIEVESRNLREYLSHVSGACRVKWQRRLGHVSALYGKKRSKEHRCW